MNPTKSGLSSVAKTGIVVVLVVLVLGGAYIVPLLSKGGTAQSSSKPVVSCASPSGGNQTISLLTLFACFSQMQVEESINTSPEAGGGLTLQTFSYDVLGTASFNSTQHIKVEFSQVGAGPQDKVIAWFNSAGAIDRLDELASGKNYTGPGAPYFAALYTSGLGFIPEITDNATLNSMLSKTSENTTSIGPTQLDVSTYHLVVPNSQYKSVTVKYATIPGTTLKFAVFVDLMARDGSEIMIQVSTVTK